MPFHVSFLVLEPVSRWSTYRGKVLDTQQFRAVFPQTPSAAPGSFRGVKASQPSEKQSFFLIGRHAGIAERHCVIQCRHQQDPWHWRYPSAAEATGLPFQGVAGRAGGANLALYRCLSYSKGTGISPVPHGYCAFLDCTFLHYWCHPCRLSVLTIAHWSSPSQLKLLKL